VREFLRSTPRARARMKSLGGATLLALEDAAGIPVALLLASYTGVLLSCTANPLWCRNPWIAPHFCASAIAAGADAITLGLTLTGGGESPGLRAIDRIGTLAHVAEAATLAGLARHAGEKARPLTRGPSRNRLVVGLGSLLVAEGLRRLPVEGRARTAARLAAAGLGLFGGFSLRSAIFEGGRAAAKDPRLSRLASKPERPEIGTRAASPVKPRFGGRPI
jgi:formate-dependent nitrite reductase membrane component NrfD